LALVLAKVNARGFAIGGTGGGDWSQCSSKVGPRAAGCRRLVPESNVNVHAPPETKKPTGKYAESINSKLQIITPK